MVNRVQSSNWTVHWYTVQPLKCSTLQVGKWLLNNMYTCTANAPVSTHTRHTFIKPFWFWYCEWDTYDSKRVYIGRRYAIQVSMNVGNLITTTLVYVGDDPVLVDLCHIVDDVRCRDKAGFYYILQRVESQDQTQAVNSIDRTLQTLRQKKKHEHLHCTGTGSVKNIKRQSLSSAKYKYQSLYDISS